MTYNTPELLLVGAAKNFVLQAPKVNNQYDFDLLPGHEIPEDAW